jgi:hypothetical protein
MNYDNQRKGIFSMNDYIYIFRLRIVRENSRTFFIASSQEITY